MFIVPAVTDDEVNVVPDIEAVNEAYLLRFVALYPTVTVELVGANNTNSIKSVAVVLAGNPTPKAIGVCAAEPP